MEKNTSQKILAFLEEHPPATVRQISRALRLTPADVRYHLADLIRQNIVTSYSPSKTGERGRPAKTYSLGFHVRPNNIIALTRASLTVLFEKSSPDHQSSVNDLAGQLFPAHPERIGERGSLTSKIIRLISLLNSAGYESRWEARSEHPCIIFANCPYRSLLAQFPQLCEVDKAVLENHLDLPVTLDRHIHPFEMVPATCQFSIHPIKKP